MISKLIHTKNWLPVALFTLTFACTPTRETAEENPQIAEAQQFIDTYNENFLTLYKASSEAEWQANIRIVEGDTTNTFRVQQANEKLAEYTGSEEVIRQAEKYLDQKDNLEPLQVKQLRNILYAAASNPATVKDLVKEKIKADALQNDLLFGYDFQIENQSVSTNDIDEILKGVYNLDSRLAAWEASKEVGTVLRDGLLNLKKLRNETVQALGYDNFFEYQVSDYGMSTEEMLQLNEKLVSDIWPLYRELHTYARYELAEKYGAKEVPDYLPAHWLPNRWGQDWSPMVSVEGLDLDPVLEEKGSEWLVKQAERFYISIGFDSLPGSFYELSSLYPAPADANYKKNNHASAWHMDLQKDVRCLMSVIPNEEWYETTHHELGHIYYYISYTNPDVPPLLRGGANRAFHEAVGSMMGLAAMQRPFIQSLGLVDETAQTDTMKILLKEALNYVVFIPFSAGVMTHFEQGLYSGEINEDALNKHWWDLAKKYQGMEPPSDRGEKYTDAASKTHINNDAAQYYDYAISFALLFQLHNHIAKNILNQDPKATNYYGNKEVGAFLKEILSPGATVDWRELIKESTGEEFSAKAMLEYFEPLMAYLQKINEGRKHTLPESI